jgi:ABC-type polysaccharide/polyol phosphate transport system ATPase subunit
MTNIGDIEVENVWKTFRIFQDRNTTLKQALLRRRSDVFEEFWALRDVSFRIPSGSSFGIIGANGAGKSTMLKLLARILVPDRGVVRPNGRVSALLELGAGFHPELTGRENVFLNGSILGMSTTTIRSKLPEIIEFSGLESFIDQPVKTYSSGMFARLGFSVAVAVEPDILLVDEVLAVGDEQFQRRSSEKMNELRSGGRTVVLVSHGLSQIQQMCDQAVWLDHGTVKVVGNTEDVVNAYLASVTTAFRLDSKGRQRTGSGEIELELDLVSSEPGEAISTGDAVTLRFHWSTKQKVPNVAIGFTIRATDGYAVAGTSDVYARTDADLGPGTGWVDYTIPRLDLLPGAYHIAAALTDRNSGHVYDFSPHIAEFDVAASTGREAATGVLDLRGSWVTGDRG